jgi:hypothetical protein
MNQKWAEVKKKGGKKKKKPNQAEAPHDKKNFN